MFRPSNLTFSLSNRMLPTGVDLIIPTGPPSFGYLPVVAEWTGASMAGQTMTKVGVFQPSSGNWYLVSTSVPDDCATDHCVGPFGGSGDLPVAFGQSVIRAN